MMFLSAVCTLILTAPIHCRGSNVEQVNNANFLKLIYVLDDRFSFCGELFLSGFYFTFYIYAFSRCFYPKRLAVHSGYIYIYFYQYVCSLGIEPTTFCAANAMLYH